MPRMRETLCRSAVIGISVILAGLHARASQIDTTWEGGEGIWGDPLRWTNGTPNNGANTYNVFIDNGNAAASPVHLNFTARIDNLELDADDSIWIEDGNQLFLQGTTGAGAIANSGVIRLNASTTGTYLRPSGGPVTFSGAGVLLLGDSPHNWVYQESGGSIVNLNSHRIVGAGNLGWGLASTAITNHGLIASAYFANPLHVTSGNAPFINTGLLGAENSSTLSLDPSAGIDNSGTIYAETDSIVNINGTTIRGGTLTTFSTGVIQGINGGKLDGSTSPMNNTGLLQVPNDNQMYAVGDIHNSGTIRINSTGSNTYLRPDGGVLTLSGPGTLQMSDYPHNWIYQLNGGSLVNSGSHTIRGAGKLGYFAASTAFTNQGFIIAEFPANPLFINPGNAVFTNTGTLSSQNGATLSLEGNGGYDCAGGTIEVQANSFANIASTVRGGTFLTAGSGAVQALSGGVLDGTADPIINLGLLRVPVGHQPRARGTINNLGTIELAGTGTDSSHLHPNAGDLIFTGSGTLQMLNGAFNQIYQTGGGGVINGAAHTIRGAGRLGWSGAPTPINNQGTVIAEFAANGLIVDSGSAVVTNAGTLRAQGGATMTLTGPGGFTNVGGTINAQNASFVNIGNTTIRGGTLSTAGTGAIQGLSTGVLDGTTNTISNMGLLRVPIDQEFRARGTINNTGVIELTATSGGGCRLYPSGADIILTGSGTLRMSDANFNFIYQSGGGGVINSAGHTIRGAGHLGSTSAATPVANQGTIIADGANALSIEALPFTTSGSVIVNAGSTISRPNGDYTQTAGSTKVDGNLSASGFVDIQGGSLGGAGTVSKTTNAGSVAPGDPAGIHAGTLTVSGTYTQSAAGALNIELGGLTAGAEHDRLAVAGSATLDGVLRVAPINGFAPQLGQQFTIITRGSGSGAFSQVIGVGGGTYSVVYNPTSVVITVTQAPCAGLSPCDANCDGSINQFDIQPFISTLTHAQSQCGACGADGNFDGTVNVFDIQPFVDCLSQ